LHKLKFLPQRQASKYLLVLILAVAVVVISVFFSYFMALPREGVTSDGDEESKRSWPDMDRFSPYIGGQAPEIEASTLDGSVIKLSNLQGRPVVLWFMATWCPSCAVVGEAVRDVASNRAVVVVIDVWTGKFIARLGVDGNPLVPDPEGEGELRQFAQKLGGRDWLLVLDEDSELSGIYKVTRLDTLIVISLNGRIVFRSDGPVTRSILEAALKEAETSQSTQNCPICPGY